MSSSSINLSILKLKIISSFCRIRSSTFMSNEKSTKRFIIRLNIAQIKSYSLMNLLASRESSSKILSNRFWTLKMLIETKRVEDKVVRLSLLRFDKSLKKRDFSYLSFMSWLCFFLSMSSSFVEHMSTIVKTIDKIAFSKLSKATSLAHKKFVIFLCLWRRSFHSCSYQSIALNDTNCKLLSRFTHFRNRHIVNLINRFRHFKSWCYVSRCRIVRLLFSQS